MNKAVAYYRVSSEQQGKSGLGLEAQQQSVRDFAAACNMELVQELNEVESGRNDKRPMLLKALKTCRREKATLLIAKLDRLGRNVAFISALKQSDVDFIAVDYPSANKLILHIMAAFAEYERDQTSERTKLALAAAKKRGVKLGTSCGELSQRNIKRAWEFASMMKPIVDSLVKEGHTTVRKLTAALNKQKVKTFRGKRRRWHLRSVHMLLKRIEQLQINTPKIS